MKYYLIIILFVTLSSCTKKVKVFDNIEPTSDNYTFYFIPEILDSLKFYSDTTSIEIFPGFMIDNQVTIKQIMDDWNFEIDTVKERNRWNLYYQIELAKNNELFVSRTVNERLSRLFHSKGILKFSKEFLLRYKQDFKPIEAYSVKIKTLTDARSFVKLINQERGYLPYHNEYIPYFWEKFSGAMKLNCLNVNTPDNEIDEFINNKFSNITETDLVYFDRNYTDDTANFEIFVESDITNNLPDGFVAETNWREFTDLEFLIFNLSKIEIQEIAKRNNIVIETFTKIEY